MAPFAAQSAGMNIEKHRRTGWYTSEIYKWCLEHYKDRDCGNHIIEYIKTFNICYTTGVKAFKQRYNVTPIKVMQSKRYSEAKRLLENTDMAAYEISLELGFSKPSDFTEFFAKYNGMTPIAYRNIMKK